MLSCVHTVPSTLTFTTLRCASTSAAEFKAPPYPYGPSTRYRRRNTGLYDGTTIQFGNMISEKKENKSRRVWRPNVHSKRLWSNYLGRFLKVKVTSRALRTMDKVGGLDEYVVGSDAPARIKDLGVIGWELRWRVMQTKGYRERVLAQRRELGLPERGWVVEEKDRRTAEKREALRVAEAYLNAVEGEKKEAKHRMLTAGSVEEAVDQATEEVVEGLEASSAAPEQEEAEKETEIEHGLQAEKAEKLAETKDATAQDSTPVLPASNELIEPATPPQPSPPPPPASQQLYTQLATIATQINSHPHSLLKQTRDLIANRTAQAATTATAKTHRLESRTALVSAISTALAAPKHGPILTLYAEQIARAREEDTLRRQREGKKALTRKQMELNVLGPPSDIPPQAWAAVRKRVREIKRSLPRRLKEKRERGLAFQARMRERERPEWREERERERGRRWRQLGLVRRVRFTVVGWFGRLIGRVRGTGRVMGKKGEKSKIVG